MYIRIRNLREDSDITQAEMSKILNCSQQVYSNYELGQRDIPTDILIKLSKYYNVSIDYLLGLTNKKERNI
ncbi:MAG: helix-turn-helix transcriptional regulator [Oscillospiraceae bacterium]|nr:helix-turn-helix transcriptional regulator [Oscillospiraceae bacterium]